MGNTQARDLNVPKYGFKVVIAIDFGTANTGYAFALVNDETQIRTGTFHNMLPADRVPTVLLLKPNREFHSLGDEASDYFTCMSPGEQRDFYFFRLFKMELYKASRLSVSTTLQDYSGKKMLAVDVFAKILQHHIYLAYEVLAQEQKLGIKKGDIQWVLTVPAIWSDEAREFMIKAAIKAGANGNKVRLVLEPEAASMYCRRQLMYVTGASSIETLPVGHRYVLADLGGGTADICAHEVLPDGKLRELYKASGGEFGGATVDQEFQNYMIKVVGGHAWERFRLEYPICFLSFIKAFEDEKKRFKTNSHPSPFTVEKPLIKIATRENEENFKKCVESTPSSKGTTFDSNTHKLKISQKLMVDLFEPSVSGIAKLFLEVIDKCSVGSSKGIETILLVGGFSESQYLRSELRSRLQDKVNIRLEQQPLLAVMKGAVQMGFKPKNIVERVARFTYGFSVTTKFQPKVHPAELRVERDGTEYCDEVFDVLIKAGTIVKFGDSFSSTSRDYMGKELKNQPAFVTLYRSATPDPKYCTEDGCERLAEITIMPPPGGWPMSVKFIRSLQVTDTQLVVKVFDFQTKREYETKVSFLEEL